MDHSDYYWKRGKPYGVSTPDAPKIYKIVSDPYYKRISIEQYQEGEFSHLVYDSHWLDFRRLTPESQTAWERFPTQSTTPGEESYLIRDHDHRIILREIYQYEQHLCRACRILTPQGIFLAEQRVYYELLGDPFNGVTLFDTTGRPILNKRYAFEPTQSLFTDLLSEEWDFSKS